ncbi:hypothetical protein GCM10009677_38100 [Sphaerisporangium rubeum]
MFRRYTASAHRAMARAGLLSLEAGRTVLDEDAVLLALAETRPFEGPLGEFSLDAEAVRVSVVPPGEGESLAALGIDTGRVRRRMAGLFPVDDPAHWHLRRSTVRPLRVTLYGPVGELVLTARARKVVEVAAHHGGTVVTGEDLLRGLLADGRNRSISLLRHHGVPLHPLAAALGLTSRAA